MFSVRCTRKLLKRGAPKKLPVPVPATTVLGDWYANIVFTRPEQLVVCISARTLLPVIVTAKDIKHLPDRVAEAAGRVLKSIGVAQEDIDAELSEMSGGCLATTEDRRILGSLNDFVFHFEHGAGSHPELSIHERTLRLAGMPCGALEYVFPSEATVAAFAANRTLRGVRGAV